MCPLGWAALQTHWGGLGVDSGHHWWNVFLFWATLCSWNSNDCYSCWLVYKPFSNTSPHLFFPRVVIHSLFNCYFHGEEMTLSSIIRAHTSLTSKCKLRFPISHLFFPFLQLPSSFQFPFLDNPNSPLTSHSASRFAPHSKLFWAPPCQGKLWSGLQNLQLFLPAWGTRLKCPSCSHHALQCVKTWPSFPIPLCNLYISTTPTDDLQTFYHILSIPVSCS